ncbi:hypothetical protein JVT61DRAFT_4494 [Boletus reticuloceps]|uniref:NAD(P)-binding protein n=1 Tax=Boletus reticuloceps TaxID=495285 RepID=A0A8I2YNZ1_9AGAM|nr:hypothetical protein JVT61DRAFT_4494 [Boletus reticuloceps]
MHSPKVWLITGASSGFGKALSEVVLRKGDIVVATLRRPSVLAHLSKQYPPSQLLLLTLDVTRPSDISAAFSRTQQVFGRLDVVFNNAGYAVFGEVEGTPDADARALLEVVFWGAVGVSRAAVKFFREVNPPGQGGVILQNSSISGFSAAPGFAFYSAGKHAIEGFTESLSKELSPEWNIKICILQPGAFYTNVIAAIQTFPVHPAYAECVTAAVRDTFEAISFDGDPYKFGEMLYRLVTSADNGKKIPLFLPVGEDALQILQGRMRKMNKVLVDAAPWSADLKKVFDKGEAKL